MKILFITNTFPPNICGVGDYTYFLCKQFVQNGDDCVVVCRKDEHIRNNVEGISVYPVVNEWNREATDVVLDVVMHEQPNVISLQYVPHGFNAKGLPFAMIGMVRDLCNTGIPIFTFVHEPFVMFCDFNPVHWGVGLCERYIISNVIDCSAAVATSIMNYKKRMSFYRKDISLIPIAPNIPLLQLDNDKKLSLKEKIKVEDCIIVALFGMRDRETILEAVRNLVAKGKHIKLLLLGKSEWVGEQPSWLYRTGKLTAEELAEYFNIVDVFVLPEHVSKVRKRSGACLKSGSLAAAIQYKLPVLTARGDHTDAILKDKLMFANFHKVDDVEAKLLRLIEDDELRKKLSNGYGELCSLLTWEHTFNEYKRIINEII